ncbi:sensory box histidine kinase/response regulator [Legionella busanensis]|uniref:Sensory box histidine kinase/response regulator n=1 Tax=Legionella busanensis TaxID=190655 RepID=A0A378JL73_9GAMM|nr:response regulator [Legionella busanensis]STX51985.1 sensory box histidine kinase/response regulator [Legionella busanensis]
MIDNKHKSMETLHLLLIEENPIASRLVEIIISKIGFHLTSVTSGEQAIKIIKQIPFDIIITNISLPGISGIELCQQIRALEYKQQNENIPFIGLANSSSEIERQACLQAGMNGIFIKPLDLMIIRSIIAKFFPKFSKLLKQPKPLINISQSQSEPQIFKLVDFPILDPIVGINNTGGENLLRELIILLQEELALDKESIYDAYKKNDYKRIKELAHKMRSSAIYCGAIKLHKACQYTEDGLKINNPKLLAQLSSQLLDVIEETKLAIDNYLTI